MSLKPSCRMRGEEQEGEEFTYALADAAVAFCNQIGVGAIQDRYLHSKLHSTAMTASVVDSCAVNIDARIFAGELGRSVYGIELASVVAGCPWRKVRVFTQPSE